MLATMRGGRPAVLLSVLLLSGCGNPGSPLPPSLMLPQPVVDLGAYRTGNDVALHWTMTRRTTDRLLLKGDQRAAICRALGTGECEAIAVLLLSAGGPGSYTDHLPADLAEGPVRLVRYEVRLENRKRRDSGASNPAYTLAGWAPPPVLSVGVTPEEKGLVVSWKAPVGEAVPVPGAKLMVRMQRDRILGAADSAKPDKEETRAGVPQPLEQTLEAPMHPPVMDNEPWSPDHIVDADARFSRSYRYTVQFVEQMELNGHFIEISGVAGQSAVVAAKDTFPPAVPSDLAAVANAGGNSIDLSWTAGAEPDLAGYRVYRRIAGAQAAPVRVSGADLLTTPAWSDTAVSKGERYAYSVSATDTSGNESGRSPEVVEALPADSQ